MNLYVAVDNSVQIILNGVEISGEKLQCAQKLVASLLATIDHSEVNISLIRLDNNPKVVSEGIKSVSELGQCGLFSKDSVNRDAIPNFTALAELIRCRHRQILNYELIVILSASEYYQIPITFRLPCAIRFVAITHRVECARQLLIDVETISRESALEIGLLTTFPSSNPSSWCQPLQVSTSQSDIVDRLVDEVVAELARKNGAVASRLTENYAILHISPTFSVEVFITPGLLAHTPFAIFDEETLSREACVDGQIATSANDGRSRQRSGEKAPKQPRQILQLLGFVKATNLLHLPCVQQWHFVAPKALGSGENTHGYHLFTESLGIEGQLAVFRHHASGEECLARALRNDTAEPWQLCLQFYASGRFKWKSPVVVDEIKPELPVVKSTVDRPKPTISYKMNAQRSYWTDAYGLQADVLKIGRLLKRVDRRDQFYEEMRRIALYALACGYDTFAPTMASLMERRCAAIPDENRLHMVRVCEALRAGGFKQITTLTATS